MCQIKRTVVFCVYTVLVTTCFSVISADENVTEISTTSPTTAVPSTSLPSKDVDFKIVTPFVHGLDTAWSVPKDLRGQLKDLVIHWCPYLKGVPGDDCHAETIAPAGSTSKYHVANLQPGALYQVWLEIVLTSGERYRSANINHQITHTLSCNCDKNGVVPNSTCSEADGICKCNAAYRGHRCDRCADSFYHHVDPRYPNDTKCYHCPCQRLYSGDDLSCKYNKDNLVECSSCQKPYTGRLCGDCIINYKKARNSNNQVTCVPCTCNGFGDKNHLKGQCDFNTGQCRCTKNTGGEHCEHCAAGYRGEPGNCTKIPDPDVTPNNKDVKNDTMGDNTATGAIVGVCVVLGVLILILLVYIAWRKYKTWKRRPGQFWTVELSQDTEDLTFQTDQDWNDHQYRDDSMLINSNSYVGRFSAPPGEEPNPYMSITVS